MEQTEEGPGHGGYGLSQAEVVQAVQGMDEGLVLT